MAGDTTINAITVTPKTYTIKEAHKEVKRQQSLPKHKQSRWYEVETENRVYFTGY